jgi:uncharacterized protein (DUF488 family)
MRFFTIGVYNSTEQSFFNKLGDAKINTFIDVRQRRGVRGKKYSFVNSNYLQKKLAELGIRYIHSLDLAPTKEIRQIQTKSDIVNEQNKRQRQKLSAEFINAYNAILSNFDFNEYIKNFYIDDNVVFFCVEENKCACHRSLITDYLKTTYSYPVNHL